MPTATAVVAAASVLLLCHCGKHQPAQPAAAGAASSSGLAAAAPARVAAAAATLPTQGGPAVAPSAAASPTSAAAAAPRQAVPSEPIPGAARRKDYAVAMAEARRKAQAGDWPAAVAAFERAAEADPSSARALAELGFALGHTADLARASAVNVMALRLAGSASTKAQIHYNQGRVQEKLGHPQAARDHYGRSLVLRPNATVAAALAALLPPPRPCDKDFASLADACQCLSQEDATDRGDASDGGEAPAVCDEVGEVARQGGLAGALLVLRAGAAGLTAERAYRLVWRGPRGFRIVAELGADYSPGAFGVDNACAVERLETRQLAGHVFVPVWWTQNNHDSNMAGLQSYDSVYRHVTFCVQAADHSVSCPQTLLVESHDSLTYLDSEDEDSRMAIAELQKESPPYDRDQVLSWVVRPDGSVMLQAQPEPGKPAPPPTVGAKLW